MNIPGRMGGTQQVPIEALNSIYRELRVFFAEWESKMSSIVSGTSGSAFDKGAGPTTSDTTRIVLEDTSSANLSAIKDYLEVQNWDNIAGNSLEFIYYAGIEAGNPSGSTSNVKNIIYKKGVSTEITKTLVYNASDKVISITTT